MIGTASPGPWVIQDNAGHGIHIYSAGGAFGGGKHVAKVSNSAGVDIRANAKMIVAAPDLLAALTALTIAAEAAGWDVEPENRSALDNARAAIAKAGA